MRPLLPDDHAAFRRELQREWWHGLVCRIVIMSIVVACMIIVSAVFHR